MGTRDSEGTYNKQCCSVYLSGGNGDSREKSRAWQEKGRILHSMLGIVELKQSSFQTNLLSQFFESS